VKDSLGLHLTISYLQTVTLENLSDLIDGLIEFLNLKSENYKDFKFSFSVYTYKILNFSLRPKILKKN